MKSRQSESVDSYKLWIIFGWIKMLILDDGCLIKTFILYELGSYSKELTLKKYSLWYYIKSAIRIEKGKKITGESSILQLFSL